MVIPAEPPVWVGLVAHALSSLYRAEQDEGCCNVCCAACESLKTLFDANLLDYYARQVVASYGNLDWFDSKTTAVKRDWLASAWRLTNICQQHKDN